MMEQRWLSTARIGVLSISAVVALVIGSSLAAAAGVTSQPVGDGGTSGEETQIAPEDQQKLSDSGSSPEVLSPADAAVQAEQSPLMELAEAVTLRFGEDEAWGGAKLDSASRAVIVYWVGDPPRELREFAVATDGTPVSLRILPARNGLRAVKAALEELAIVQETQRAGILSMVIATNGDGLTVVMDDVVAEGDVFDVATDSSVLSKLREVARRFDVDIRIAQSRPDTQDQAPPGSALASGR